MRRQIFVSRYLCALCAFAALLAACSQAEQEGPLPGPRVETGVAPTTTLGVAEAPVTAPPPTATALVRLTMVANVILRVRAGPGTTFDTVGLLQVGETAGAIARSEAGDWLMIETGVVPGGRGWVSKEFASVEGDVGSLPVSAELIMAPTVPPLPEFTLAPEVSQTPLPPGAPTLTPAPTAAVTAVAAEIGFYADTLEVDYHEPCTYLRWIARPVQAIYLDGESMVGRDFIVVCPAIPSQTYTLEVVRLDGVRAVLTLTIANSGIP